ncbi:LLM class flavin-dependent oxidoreductase [Bartonella sp. HY038]|uniref:LLM class flavin-dependent oxidoreductase n=1 Tax=Bartonella sp. HY038 TaxID=2759660 RepID=UPI0015F8000B|nr:LLM class flavin-dependent oxidoreductase [Bartonella sp. HY038]
MMKKIAFLSFGRWKQHELSKTTTPQASYKQAIEMAVRAEEMGADGAYFRVHHFTEQLGAPYPLLAAIAMQTKHIEIGTSVVDLRYENPLSMLENIASADMIADQRLQFGIGRGAPFASINGGDFFAPSMNKELSQRELAQQRALFFLDQLRGEKTFELEYNFADAGETRRIARVEPYSDTLHKRIWWGSGTMESAIWAAQHGMHIQCATHRNPDTGQFMFSEQVEFLTAHKKAWDKAQHNYAPRAAIIREIIPLCDEKEDAWLQQINNELVELWPNNKKARDVFQSTYCGRPKDIIAKLKNDAAIAEADTIFIPVENSIGLEFNLKIIENILTKIAPELGWR